MNPDLEKLIRLQGLDNEIRRVEAELAEAPRRKNDLEARLAAERQRLDAARSGLEQCQRNRRRLEGELNDLEARRSRYKGQLMEVKTNKEYTAMLHEIEGVEREIRGREDLILGEMEKAEGLTVEVRREEELFRREETRHDEEGRALQASVKALEEALQRQRAERTALAAEIPADLLELFARVAKFRGTAVAEAREGRCEACHLRLRPQMFVDVKRNDAVTQCPQCSRILYFEPPPQAVAP
ncbi:MAG TPA: C4-type zinc ribbon domain-containing protein [Vicinamibacteria bacterium]|nr:C4-type zinc ribbon domain-containing protein [Vicinamibacteria bacterium]